MIDELIGDRFTLHHHKKAISRRSIYIEFKLRKHNEQNIAIFNYLLQNNMVSFIDFFYRFISMHVHFNPWF